MKQIAAAVQEAAAAYLARQFRTLGVFAVGVFFLLFLLPADGLALAVGRPAFFLVGAPFSATAGDVGMWLAVRGNVRMAAAAAVVQYSIGADASLVLRAAVTVIAVLVIVGAVCTRSRRASPSLSPTARPSRPS